MITYSKTFWGIHLLSRLYGSPALRCLPMPLLSALMTALLFHYWKDKDTAWRHPYPYAASAFVVGFVVIFRNNFGYQRYWEGRTLLQGMTARWSDAFMQAYAFFSHQPEDEEENPDEYRETLMHLFSLLHGLALQHLRGDWDLNNLHAMQATDDPPPVDPAATKYMFRKPHGPGNYERIWLSDYFVLTGTDDRRCKYNRSMPIGVIGGVSSVESQLLGIKLQHYEKPVMETAICGSQSFSIPHTVHLFFGLSTGTYVPLAAERVQIVYSWILQLMKQRLMEDKYGFPPPVANNLFRMLSEGLQDFENARKLEDTPFPFPWAQVVLLLLVVFAFTFPILVVSYIEKLWLALLIDIIGVQSYFSLNEVARDLEDPFVYAPNEIALTFFQYQFNKRLQAGCSHLRPPYYHNGVVCMEPRVSFPATPRTATPRTQPDTTNGAHCSL